MTKSAPYVTLPISLAHMEALVGRQADEKFEFSDDGDLSIYVIGTIRLPEVQIESISLPKMR